MPINNTIAFASLVLNILVLLVASAGFIKITANDLKHLTADVKAIRESQEKTEGRIEKLEIGQIKQEVICNERSTMYRLNKRINATKRTSKKDE